MTDTRYCSTCGALLSQGAVVCGECGARFQASPFHKKATDAPVAWGKAPVRRRQENDSDAGALPEEPGVELISRESLEPTPTGMTAMRPGADQYDRTMAASNPPSHLAAPAAGEQSQGAPEGPRGVLERPLDGCTPAAIGKRLIAWLIDCAISGLVAIPLTIGAILISVKHHASLLAQILVGIGVVLPLLYLLVLVWMEGTKGSTPGKLAMGLRTVRHSKGGTIGLGGALGRAVLLGLPVIGLVMAVLVLVDPRRTGRGGHDRITDAVVIDIREGRNGIQPRPDDFERHGADHYMPREPVAVTTHDNLMSSPGAAWGVGSPSAAPSTQDVHSGASSWAPDAVDEAPMRDPQGGYAPQAGPGGYAPQAGQSGYAPQAEVGGHAPQAEASGHGAVPAEAPAPGGYAPPNQQVAQQVGQQVDQQQVGYGPLYGHGDQVGQHQQVGQDQQVGYGQSDRPGDQMGHGEQSGPAGYAPYAQQAGHDVSAAPAGMDAPAVSTSAPQAPAPHAPSPAAAAVAAPDDDDDDRTRMAMPVAHRPEPAAPRLRIRLEDGTQREGQAPLVLGRNPAVSPGRTGLPIEDSSRSISKTHLLLDVVDDVVRATDLGSTNGSALVAPDGQRRALSAETAVDVPAGSALALGDRVIHVELLT